MAPEDYVFSARWAGTNGEAPKPGRGLFLKGASVGGLLPASSQRPWPSKTITTIASSWRIAAARRKWSLDEAGRASPGFSAQRWIGYFDGTLGSDPPCIKIVRTMG